MADSQTTNGTSPDTTGDTEGQGTSTLDRRRDKLQATQAAAAAAAGDVESLDEQLTSNAGLHTGHEADLQATLDRVAILKKTIKASARNRARLLAARKSARSAAATSRLRADTAEARYDKAVLADLLRREKDHDLSAHGGRATVSGPTDTSPAAGSAGTATPGTATPRTPRTARSSTTRSSTARTGATRQSATTTRPRTEAAADSDRSS